MAELLIIVARDQPLLYERLCLELDGDPDLAVVLDRRVGERRRAPHAVHDEQPRADRRRVRADAQLARLGWTTVRTH